MELTRDESSKAEALRGLADILHALPLGLIVLDAALEVVFLNRAAERIFGAPVDLAGRLTATVPADRQVDWRAELRRAVRTGERRRFESIPCTGQGGERHTLNLTLLPLEHRIAGGRWKLLLLAEDVTRQADLEKRLLAAESLAAVGRLAARVAHELNNPLDGVLRYVNLSSRLLGDTIDAKVPGYLEQARQGLARMARIVGELLEFSRSAPLLDESGNINWIVEEALHSMREHADANEVVVTASFHDDKIMPVVEGTRLYQVCCNLIKNAIDAMPAGGRLTITTAVIEEQVVIRFEDTGVGLPEDPQRVFEPFYTTKPAGEGTGLGLAICRDYVEQLHGRITAERGDEKGAVFTVRVPIASCTAPVERQRNAQEQTE